MSSGVYKHKKGHKFPFKERPRGKGKVPWNKGMKMNDTFREECRKRLLGKKQIRSEDGKRRFSEKMKGKKRSSESIDKFRKSMTGTKRSKEARENMRNSHLGEKHSEVQNQKHREWMINNPIHVFKDTKIELKIEAELQKRDINYQKQVGLCNAAKVDFYLPDYRIAIECDGCYWHNCPLHGKGEVRNRGKNDVEKNNILSLNGYKIYRFWEHEINESTEKCMNRIEIK